MVLFAVFSHYKHIILSNGYFLNIMYFQKEEKVAFNLSGLIEIRDSHSHYHAHNDLEIVQIIYTR